LSMPEMHCSKGLGVNRKIRPDHVNRSEAQSTTVAESLLNQAETVADKSDRSNLAYSWAATGAWK
jgi:hypothetical protein